MGRKARALVPWLLMTLVALAGCRPQRMVPAGPTFVPPTQPPTPTPLPATPTPLPTPTFTPAPPATPTACVNDLRFVADETLPDHSQVQPGQELDKAWRVLNAGTCPWGPGYTLRFLRGLPLGAESPQPLYPAKPGAEVVLRIRFIAPEEPGIYSSLWQAFDPQGQPFGEPIYILFEVVEPTTPTPPGPVLATPTP